MKNLLQKKLPKRFTDAVSKLYNAFHKGELDYGICTKCAVGSIVGHGNWLLGSPLCIFNGNFTSLNKMYDNDSGYSTTELSVVERVFVLAFKDNREPENKETQFKGLCAVVEYLCELDNIPNVMDIQSLFEYENETPKKQLSEVILC